MDRDKKPPVPSQSNEKMMRRGTSVTRQVTKDAIGELQCIVSWEELGRVCAEQKRKRDR